jgi:hypothetical protein
MIERGSQAALALWPVALFAFEEVQAVFVNRKGQRKSLEKDNTSRRC